MMRHLQHLIEIETGSNYTIPIGKYYFFELNNYELFFYQLDYANGC